MLVSQKLRVLSEVFYCNGKHLESKVAWLAYLFPVIPLHSSQQGNGKKVERQITVIKVLELLKSKATQF